MYVQRRATGPKYRRPKNRRRGDTWMKVKEEGKCVARARGRAGISQRDLAAMCSCTQATISLIENGKMATLSDVLGKKISAKLNRDVEELFEPESIIRKRKVTSVRPNARQVAAA